TSNSQSDESAVEGNPLTALAGLSFSASYEGHKPITLGGPRQDLVTRPIALGTVSTFDDTAIALALPPCPLTLPQSDRLSLQIGDTVIQQLPRIRLAPITATADGSLQVAGVSVITDSGSVTAQGDDAVVQIDSMGNPSVLVHTTALGASTDIRIGLNLNA